jgi:hypothetical protein
MDGETNLFSDDRYFSPSDSRIFPKNGISSEDISNKNSIKEEKDKVIEN